MPAPVEADGLPLALFALDGRTPWSAAETVVAARRALYDGFRAGAEATAPAGAAGLLIDQESGAAILADAADRGFVTARAVGAIGDSGFDAERRGVLTAHARSCRATYWKVLVPYNPDSSPALNSRHAARLRQLSDDLPGAPGPRLLCDLVVPPTREQICGGIRAYERALPALISRAIVQLVDAGADPHLWGIEVLERFEDCSSVVAAAALGGRCEGCLVRAAGHGAVTTRARMAVGLSTPGVTGAIVNRALFWEPVADWINGRSARTTAVAVVAARVRSWLREVEGRRECEARAHDVARCWPAPRGAALLTAPGGPHPGAAES